MRLVERTNIRKSEPYFSVIDDLAWRAKNLYNLANFHVRQEFFKTGNYIGFFDLYHLLKTTDAYLDLPTKVSKQVVKRVAKTWKGFMAAHRDWQKNPGKYLGEPRIPRYLDKEQGRYLVPFPVDAISKPTFKQGFVKPSMTEMLIPTKVTGRVCEVRFVPGTDCYVMEVVYEVPDTELTGSNGIVAGIDLGLNNLCTVAINKADIAPLIVNGKGLKAVNQLYNKTRAKFQSKLTGKRKSSKRLRQLTQKRNQRIDSALHQASRLVLNYCMENNVSVIVVGYNSQWKQNISIGKRNNQQFVQLSHRKLVEQLKYKASLLGIEVIETEESYTSKCSALDLEPLKKQATYLGKRVMRGLFQTAKGLRINADHNGAINIIRKVFSDELVSELIEALPLCPRVVNPV
ncbi:transposase [Thermosynechococcaceae cyanobacterium BACA0444]|uniref:Transposase n=1 Tax=Pseudocalidococcus azoricus BACA0444 TaxID=2918990 RepID=A0AAE4FT85_9CYAN|nr:transposase [Pseudocalidococcus azoricus]MDS3861428.1 transposase [Pseudocalidococcus azoricus BACA0444]